MHRITLAEMIAMAREHYTLHIEVKTAVLTAWAALSGLKTWTAEMVRQVEKEMR